MRIIVICSHPFGLPTVQALAKEGLLKGFITSNNQPEFDSKFGPVLKYAKTPKLYLTKNRMVQKLAIFLRQHKADVVFVLSFNYLIPTKLLKIPKWGFLNFHPSNLPQYRGPNPAFWQVKDQLKMGGVTVHKMDAKFDTGPIIANLSFPIQPEMTCSHYLSEAGFVSLQLASMVLQALQQMGQLPERVQDNKQASYLNRPTLKDRQIDWKMMEVAAIRALVNACNPSYGGAITFLKGQPLQILEVKPIIKKTTASIGEIVELNGADGLVVACKNGELLSIEIVQSAEGIMTGKRFATMAQLKKGEFFS